MRKIVRKVLQILDGTPTPQTNGSNKGQSVVELALVTPLIIIMLVGLIEVGWFAQRYLTLLEVTRVGARRGATLSAEFGPLAWNDSTTILGNAVDYADRSLVEQRDYRYPPVDPDNGFNYTVDEYNNVVLGNLSNTRECGNLGPSPGFYSIVLCQMISSIDPLEIRRFTIDEGSGTRVALPEEQQTDDIIISVFSVEMINNAPPPAGATSPALGAEPIQHSNFDFDAYYAANPPELARSATEFRAGWNPVVVGRYPTNANECTMWEITEGPSAGAIFRAENPVERDPFDYINDGEFTFSDPIDYAVPQAAGLMGYDAGGTPRIINRDSSFGEELPVTFPLEMFTGDALALNPIDLDLYDLGAGGVRDVFTYNSVLPEYYRGWVYTGFRQVEAAGPTRLDDDPISVTDVSTGAVYPARPFCFGSDWTVYDIQNLLLGNEFDLTAEEIDRIRAGDPTFGLDCGTTEDPRPCVPVDTGGFLTDQGVILVEIYWQHNLLLDIPGFSPVLNVLGGDTTIIYVWSAFPIPTAEPNINYDLTWQNFVDG